MVAPYGIRVMAEARPSQTVPYTMLMVGGNSSDLGIGSASAVAPNGDCDADNQRQVAFVFMSGGIDLLSKNVAQMAGVVWGLDNALDCASPMALCDSGMGADAYVDGCADLCGDACNATVCGARHEMFCDPGQQNEHAELMWLFGGNGPDMQAPTAEIVQPMDGAQFEVGQEVEIRALVGDDFEGFGWKFVVTRDGEKIHDQVSYDRIVDDMGRAALGFVNLEAGSYEVTVEVEDHADNVTTDTITFLVGDQPGEGGSSGGPMTGDTADASGSSGSSGSSGEDEDTGAGAGEPDDSGCSCRTKGPGTGSSLGALGLLTLWWRRRRDWLDTGRLLRETRFHVE